MVLKFLLLIGLCPFVAQGEQPVVVPLGIAIWGDVEFVHGWKIQRAPKTDLYRLIDPKKVRHAQGSLELCRKSLRARAKKEGWTLMSGKAAIAIHGLGRSERSIASLQTTLKDNGYTVINFDYPSTRLSVGDCAEYLDSVIDHLEGIEQIDIVAFSMGGIVARSYFQQHHDPRLKRVVFLGTPHQGSELAEFFFEQNPSLATLSRWVVGPAASELTPQKLKTLPSPPIEFAIIAGGTGNRDGFSPLLLGDDDTVVSVKSTQLEGAREFCIIPSIHPVLPKNRQTRKLVIQFLEEGKFSEPDAEED